MNNKMTASRSTGFNHGLVFSAKPLEEDEIFEVIIQYKQYCVFPLKKVLGTDVLDAGGSFLKG